MKRLLTLILLAYLTISAQGQTSLPIPRNIKAAYDKGTRNMTGAPGEKYWQKAIKELNLGTSMIPNVNTNDNNLVVK